MRRFWLDNWAGEPLLGPRPIDASLTIAEGWNIIPELWHLILTNLHQWNIYIYLELTEIN